MLTRKNLSGGQWWKQNSACFPNSRELAALRPDFRERVARFIEALRRGGANVVITSTLRHPGRAYVLHHAWNIANGRIAAGDVPARPGVPIEWDHGSEKASRAAAAEIVRLARMAYPASLTSNHIRGTAIDMNITWKGTLPLRLPGSPSLWEITSTPRTGSGNKELHRIGAVVFGVKKLATDPPHWSHDGR